MLFGSACRAIGIPCRSVTNYNSAHDTDVTMTIDNYITPEDAEDVSRVCNDSIWNFHVWNDAWMARYDLPQGYGGWQAIDATPQEIDEEGMQRFFHFDVIMQDTCYVIVVIKYKIESN